MGSFWGAVMAGEPTQGYLFIRGQGALGGSGGQDGRRVVWGDGLGGEGYEVGVVGGRQGVDGLDGGEGCLQRASVLPPCAAWRMRMRWARAATQALRRDAEAAVERRRLSGMSRYGSGLTVRTPG
ncbi:MAG: hypothetical protein OXG26_03770 [Caldilineaceae bacterium]|nr:hypothetical protein [Caldilineaceae bacterium]